MFSEPASQQVLDAAIQHLLRDIPDAEIEKIEGWSYVFTPYTWGVSVYVKGRSHSLYCKVSRDMDGNLRVRM